MLPLRAGLVLFLNLGKFLNLISHFVNNKIIYRVQVPLKSNLNLNQIKSNNLFLIITYESKHKSVQ